MKQLTFLLFLSFTLLISCSKEGADDGRSSTSNSLDFADGFTALSSESSGEGGGSAAGYGGGEAGVITAGEWNDLKNWLFLEDLLKEEDYRKMPSYWDIDPRKRFSIELTDINNRPLPNQEVRLVSNNTVTQWVAQTDKFGRAELFANPFESAVETETNYKIVLENGFVIAETAFDYLEGINRFQVEEYANVSRTLELAFMIDATGSMGDELEYLKTELNDVIDRVQNDNSELSIRTSTVFYKDEGDDYVTKRSPWTSNISETVDFISDQSAGGGGDFPEAVHTALNESIILTNWSNQGAVKLCFILLDAPPHYDESVIEDLQNSIAVAAKQGIKLIPVVASGINKETEFLMRFMSILTNGTYVFITDDSGIGNPHLIASVGEYEVEFLNDLMVRLINEYSSND